MYARFIDLARSHMTEAMQMISNVATASRITQGAPEGIQLIVGGKQLTISALRATKRRIDQAIKSLQEIPDSTPPQKNKRRRKK